MNLQQSRWCFLGPAVFKNDPSRNPEGGCCGGPEEVDMAA